MITAVADLIPHLHVPLHFPFFMHKIAASSRGHSHTINVTWRKTTLKMIVGAPGNEVRKTWVKHRKAGSIWRQGMQLWKL